MLSNLDGEFCYVVAGILHYYFFSTDEQLKSLNEKNKELEAAQDRNAAIQVLRELEDKLKDFG